MERSEDPFGLGDDAAAIGDFRQIAGNKQRLAPRGADVASDRFAALGMTTGDNDAGGTSACQEPRRRLSKALCAAGNDRVLSRE